ncbi:MAG: GDSL-type esterase/lipase family protein [Corallococcus sp.]|nr:GDSL-type esterase/lipase family protein [Corallococcus sp.]MCM1359491.1 GDSL-type esterase/lipase family protein [Corallococcus sp.]MCM1394697.1 GDSL-type esterase/lipase family protein [Corallococcus sp.]
MSVKRTIIAILAVICLTVTACFVLVACGDQEDTYTLTYSGGAADVKGTVPKTKAYKEGEKVTLLGTDVFTREGYSFSKWNDGDNDYAALQEFTMPAKNVTMTATWELKTVIEDNPTLTELDSRFYDADNWVYMTNNGGASLDGGDVPFSLSDGSVKFHRANQSLNIGKIDNGTMSFMLKGTNDWAIWFNSDSIDNRDNNSYRLVYKENKLGIAISSVSDNLAAVVSQSTYQTAEWNRIDIVFETVDNVCSIKLYVNGERAALVRGNVGSTEEVNVSKNVLKHTRPAGFETGDYVVVKVWEAHNYLQIKPVAKKDVADVPVIACIGASITEGAGADNFYTESYPAQLQRRMGADYNVINFGNSGKTVREDLTDDSGNSVAWLAQYQWQGVQKIVPDMAILNIGTNDSKSTNQPVSTTETFKQAYDHLLDELLKVNPQMEIYICTVPTAYTNIWGISEENINTIIAPVQREIASERDFTLIDLYEYSKNKSLLFGDGVHPNTHGYTMFVDIIEEVLKGDGTLSKQFLDAIDAKYNDNGKIDNIVANIANESGKLYLTVSGDTTMPVGDGLKVYVGDGKDVENFYPVSIAAGKFSVKVDLATLRGSSGWYNVRVYSDEYSHRIVLLNNTEYQSGDKFVSDEVRVIVRTWNTNWGASFSFTVDENFNTEITSSTVTSVDGTLTLTVSGTTSASSLKLSVAQKPGDDSKSNFAVDAEIVSGTFNASFDLTRLNEYTDWYNVRIYHADGSYVPVGYKQTTDGENVLEKNDAFYCADTVLTVVSWTDGGVDTLSFAVKANDGTKPVIKLTDASLTVNTANGTAILTVSGSTRGTKPTIHSATLLYLGNDASKPENFKVVAEDADGNWSGSVDLAMLEVGTNYEIRIYTRNVDGDNYGGYYTLKIGEVKADGNVVKANTEYEFASKKITVYDDESTWDPFRIKVADTNVPDPVVTATSIKYGNGQLVITANTANVTRFDFVLQNTATNPKYEQVWQNVRIEDDGSVRIVIELSELANAPAGVPLNCRMYLNGSETITKLLPESLNFAQTYNFDGRHYSLGTNAGNIKLQYSVLTGLVSATVDIEDKDGTPTLIVQGTYEGKSASEIQLKLDKTSAPKNALYFENLSTLDGEFRFEVDVSVLLASSVDKLGTSAEGYFIRLWSGYVDAHDDVAEVAGAKLADIHAVWEQEKLDVKVVIDGCTYVFYRNSTTDFDRTLGIAKYDSVLA